MTTMVEKEIEKINSFTNIDDLHDYIKDGLNLDEYTYEEFLIIWRSMNLRKF